MCILEILTFVVREKESVRRWTWRDLRQHACIVIRMGVRTSKIYCVLSTKHENHIDRQRLRERDIKIPKNYRQAISSKQVEEWRKAMDSEMSALKDKEVLREISRSNMPGGHKTIKTRWVFDVKTDHLGYVTRYRARVVARGDKHAQASILRKLSRLWHAWPPFGSSPHWVCC